MPTAVAATPAATRSPKQSKPELATSNLTGWQIELHITTGKPSSKPEGWQAVDDEC